MELSSASLLKLGSFTFWSGLYLCCSVYAPDKSPEWWSRTVTLLHGSVATVAGLSQCGVNTVTRCRLAAKIMPHQYALMVWSWGYFAFDLLWCLAYWTDNGLMLFHHFSAVAAITIYMRKTYTGCTFSCMLALLEVTNPLLQTRWLLRSEGYDKTILFLVIEVVYLVLFIGIRGILGSFLVYKIFQTDVFDLETKLISLVFYFVSVGFIYEILGYVLYKYRNKIGEFQGFLEEMGLILNDQA